MASLNGGSKRRSLEQDRLNPGNHTLRQRAGEERMLQGLGLKATKTRRVVRITKRNQTLRSVQDTMCNFPIQINYSSVQGQKEKRAPS